MARLGSAKAVHVQAMARTVKKIEEHADKVVSKVRAGDCVSADTSYMHMHQAIGEFEAHRESSRPSGTPWYPQRAVMDANGLFHDRCVRVKPGHIHDLEGAKRRRRR